MLAFSDKCPPPMAIRRNQMWDGIVLRRSLLRSSLFPQEPWISAQHMLMVCESPMWRSMWDFGCQRTWNELWRAVTILREGVILCMRLGWLARTGCCLCCIHLVRHFEGLSSWVFIPFWKGPTRVWKQGPLLILAFLSRHYSFLSFFFYHKRLFGLTVSYRGSKVGFTSGG